MTRWAVAADRLVTASPPAPVRGAALGSVEHAVVAWEDGLLTYAGPHDGFSGTVDEVFEGCTLAPGFVDCHTHLPFAGWRDDEYEARLRGVSYRDTHGAGGGIARSARMLAEAPDEEILAFSRALLDEMLAHGTTAVELKTGYGLSAEGELRQARLARRLAEEAPQTCTVTLLPCHAVPTGWEREAWVDAVCAELIPAAATMVDAVDVYVEDIAFTVEDLRRVAEAAGAHGLPVRVHADQLGDSAAAEAAVALGARSADHLNHVRASGVAALGGGETVATLLPASTLMLRAQPPPVAALQEAGAALALASDCNPGTSPVLSMPLVIALGCALYGIDPGTALVAATANPAWVLGLDDRLGTLTPGKRADVLALEGGDIRMVPYRPGHNPVRAVFVNGEPVVRSPS